MINITESKEKQGKTRFFLWYRKQTRRFKRRFIKNWLILPTPWRRAIYFAASFVGFIAAYMLFYIAALIAFSYSIIAGFGVMFIFGLCLYGMYEVMGLV